MNENHHQMLGLNALDFLQKADPDVVSMFNRGLRPIYKAYLAAPDQINDVFIEMPLGIPDRSSFLGANLSSLQHFAIPAGKNIRGYNWDMDGSLGIIDSIGDFLMSAMALDVGYDSDINIFAQTGIMEKTPMALMVENRINLDDFQFPSAVDMAVYFGGQAKKAKPGMLKAQLIGYTLHFIMDVFCNHHVRGWLLNDHTEYESKLEHDWIKLFLNNKNDFLSLIEPPIAKSIKQLARKAVFNTFKDDGKKTNIHVCADAIGACVTAIRIMM